MCGEISGDDRPGDSSDEGATMAFFWMTFFSAQNGCRLVANLVLPVWSHLCSGFKVKEREAYIELIGLWERRQAIASLKITSSLHSLFVRLNLSLGALDR